MATQGKPIVSDEEVIRALLRESRLREGKLPMEATRIRPNLNFLQRTVTNLVSTNTRLNSKQRSFIAERTHDQHTSYKIPEKFPYKSKKVIGRPQRKNFQQEKKLIPKINFVKSDEQFKCIPDPKNKFKEKYKANFVKSSETLYTTTNIEVNNRINMYKKDSLFKHFVKSDVLYSTTSDLKVAEALVPSNVKKNGENPTLANVDKAVYYSTTGVQTMVTRSAEYCNKIKTKDNFLLSATNLLTGVTSVGSTNDTLQLKHSPQVIDIKSEDCCSDDIYLKNTDRPEGKPEDVHSPSNSVIVIDSDSTEECCSKKSKRKKKKKQKHKTKDLAKDGLKKKHKKRKRIKTD